MLFTTNSHVSCFSDEDDINEDVEDGDEEGWEQVDVDEAKEEMAKKEASPAPRTTPGKTATTPPKKTQAVASIEKDMETMSMANGPKFVPFNFTHRFMLTAL